MSAITPSARVFVPPTLTESARYAVSDALAMTWRNLIRYVRLPNLLVFSTIQPVMFVLLFAYVFGGAIKVPRGSYIDFLMPGIFVQTVIFGSTQTGVGLAEDLSKGMIDRFRSLPMARSAVLIGRVLADSARNTFVVALNAAIALALIVLFGSAFSLISAFIGLSVRDVETAQVGGFIWVFPLTFASSVFVPVQSMPDWLQVFSKHSPITVTVDAARSLAGVGPDASIVPPLLWVAAIIIVFLPLAVRRYRRIT
jgi:ABC-type multidrug transport system permease subunit